MVCGLGEEQTRDGGRGRQKGYYGSGAPFFFWVVSVDWTGLLLLLLTFDANDKVAIVNGIKKGRKKKGRNMAQ